MDPNECFHRWTNINALMARYYMRAREPRGWPTYGLSIIRDGLEQESWKYPTPDPLSTDVSILNVCFQQLILFSFIFGY